ncbi:hypothetical protein Micbo1qcDRAFT_180444 [Microdochium bolleyi]|uniref:Uncharacterized protein n=1 Tax=Microdochium bolleyi TaxID=196109 RepID=A0A136ILR0_9PEZI|nr:hypothetical protein Micbo1qcDRAFT_180444 [Microdochium bolleyi]
MARHDWCCQLLLLVSLLLVVLVVLLAPNLPEAIFLLLLANWNVFSNPIFRFLPRLTQIPWRDGRITQAKSNNIEGHTLSPRSMPEMISGGVYDNAVSRAFWDRRTIEMHQRRRQAVLEFDMCCTPDQNGLPPRFGAKTRGALSIGYERLCRLCQFQITAAIDPALKAQWAEEAEDKKTTADLELQCRGDECLKRIAQNKLPFRRRDDRGHAARCD